MLFENAWEQVTEKAGDAWSQFDGAPSMKLWQIQMDHAARPSALYDLRGTAFHPTHSNNSACN